MTQSNSDEIDLQALAVNIVRYFMRYFKFISFCTLTGIVLGFVGYQLTPPKFESQMILQSDILTESHIDRLTANLDRLIREGNDSILATRLELTLSEAQHIKAIEIESVKKAQSASQDEASTFVVTAVVDQKNLLPKLQEGIINYLRTNEYVKTRVRQREEKHQLLIDKLEEEIQSLDSLKDRLFQGKPVYTKSSEMMLVDPTNIYSKIIELTEQQIENKNDLELFNSIQLIEGFTPFRKPANPKLSIMLLSGFALGFFGAIGILTAKQLLKLAAKKIDS